MSYPNINTSAIIAATFCLLGCDEQSNAASRAYSEIRPHVIHLVVPRDTQGMGGVITADIDGDGQRDFIVTGPGFVSGYAYSGRNLWDRRIDIQVTRQSEKDGLPGLHGPGVQVTDVSGDGRTEVLFLTKHGTLEILEGSTGETKASIRLQVPAGAERWEHLVVANFRGRGDRDLLLQATNAMGYRMGRFVAAYAIEELMQDGAAPPLWTKDDFVSPAHNGARVADLDGDGRDEVLGAMILGPDGDLLVQIPVVGHVDSVFVADVRPDMPGLEVIALEESMPKRPVPGDNAISLRLNYYYNRLFGTGNRVFLYNAKQIIWETHFRHHEPQNAAVGDFDPSRPGLEIWCRSRHNTRQAPFIFDAYGKLISRYQMVAVAPTGWTERGVEEIFTIDWTGKPQQLAAAKERHRAGDLAIFDPINGRFLYPFEAKADQIYVADVVGDWREELIVLSVDQLRVYSNPEPNPKPDRLRLWAKKHYLRSKMTWNYYSP